VRLILFYLLTLALMLAVIPWTRAGSTQSPFVLVMQVSRLPAAGGVMNFVVLVAALSAMNSQLYITTRMMFSLSRAGCTPEPGASERAWRAAERPADIDLRHRARDGDHYHLAGRRARDALILDKKCKIW
jgi:hypothetical protein